MDMINLLPFFLLADRKKQNRIDTADAAEVLMINQIPAGPRTLLTVVREADRADQQKQQQQAVAQREEALAQLIVEGKLVVGETKDLSNEPRVLYMIGKLSNQKLKDSVIEKLKSKGTATNPGATGTGVSRKVTNS